jgi:hypothetical protein
MAPSQIRDSREITIEVAVTGPVGTTEPIVFTSDEQIFRKVSQGTEVFYTNPFIVVVAVAKVSVSMPRFWSMER